MSGVVFCVMKTYLTEIVVGTVEAFVTPAYENLIRICAFTATHILVGRLHSLSTKGEKKKVFIY